MISSALEHVRSIERDIDAARGRYIFPDRLKPLASNRFLVLPADAMIEHIRREGFAEFQCHEPHLQTLKRSIEQQTGLEPVVEELGRGRYRLTIPRLNQNPNNKE